MLNFEGKKIPSNGDPRAVLLNHIRECENHQSIYKLKLDENVIMASKYNALPDTYSQLKYTLSQIPLEAEFTLVDLLDKIQKHWMGTHRSHVAVTGWTGGTRVRRCS